MVRFHAVHSNPILYMLLHAVHLVRSNPDPNRTLRVSIFFRWRRWNLSETDGMERTIVKERRTICCEMCLLMRHLKWTLPLVFKTPVPDCSGFLGASSQPSVSSVSSASMYYLIHTVRFSPLIHTAGASVSPSQGHK